MSNMKLLLDRNETFAETGQHRDLSPVPRQQLFVVTCMDGRIDPAHILGLDLGDALVLRNSGGRVTDEVIQEVAFIATVTEAMFGDDAPAFEVAVIHHTGCGTGFLADDDFRRRFAARVDAEEAELAALAVTDPTASVTVDVDRLNRSPLVPGRVAVSGYVYDVGTGLVTEVPGIGEVGDRRA